MSKLKKVFIEVVSKVEINYEGDMEIKELQDLAIDTVKGAKICGGSTRAVYGTEVKGVVVGVPQLKGN